MRESHEFVGEEIAVREGDGVKGPVRFEWRGRAYQMHEILSAWQDHGQPVTLRRPNWRTRRHRNYFDVRTESGERFRIYLDRGTKKSARWRWVMERKLVAR